MAGAVLKSKLVENSAVGYMPVNPAVKKLKQEDHKFESGLANWESLFQNQKQTRTEDVTLCEGLGRHPQNCKTNMKSF